MCPHSLDVAPHRTSFSPACQLTPTNRFSDGFVFLSELQNSEQLCVEGFIMTRTDVCVILELCPEFLKMNLCDLTMRLNREVGLLLV